MEHREKAGPFKFSACVAAVVATPVLIVVVVRSLLDALSASVSIAVGLVLMLIGAVIVLRPMISLDTLSEDLSESRTDRRLGDKLERLSKGLGNAANQNDWTAARAHLTNASDSVAAAALTLHESAHSADQRARNSSRLDQRLAFFGILIFVIGTGLQIGAMFEESNSTCAEGVVEFVVIPNDS